MSRDSVTGKWNGHEPQGNKNTGAEPVDKERTLPEGFSLSGQGARMFDKRSSMTERASITGGTSLNQDNRLSSQLSQTLDPDEMELFDSIQQQYSTATTSRASIGGSKRAPTKNVVRRLTIEQINLEEEPKVSREDLKRLFESRAQVREGSGPGAYDFGISLSDLNQILEDGNCGCLQSTGGFTRWEIEDSFNQCCAKYSLVLEEKEFMKTLACLARKKNIPLTILHHHLVTGAELARPTTRASLRSRDSEASLARKSTDWLEKLEKVCMNADKVAEEVPLPPSVQIAEPMEAAANDNAEQALDEFRKFVNEAWGDPMRAFDALDPMKEDRVPITNLHALLRRRGYPRSCQELRLIFKAVRLTDDKIARDDFVNLWEVSELQAVDEEMRKDFHNLQIQRLLVQSMTANENLLVAVYAPTLRLWDADPSPSSLEAADQGALVHALTKLDSELKNQAPDAELAILLTSSEGLLILTSAVNVGNQEVGRLTLSLLSKAVAATQGATGAKSSSIESSSTSMNNSKSEEKKDSEGVSVLGWSFRAHQRANFKPEDLLGDVRANGDKAKPQRLSLKPDSLKQDLKGESLSPRQPQQAPERTPRLPAYQQRGATSSRPTGGATSPRPAGEVHDIVAGDLERRLCGELWRPLFSILDPDDDRPFLSESLLPSLWALFGRIQLGASLLGPGAVTVGRVAAQLRHLRPGAAQAEQAIKQAVSGIRSLEDRVGASQVQSLAVALGGCMLLRSCLLMINDPVGSLTEGNQLLREWSRERQRLLLKWPLSRRKLDELKKYNAAAKYKTETCEKPKYPIASGFVRKLSFRNSQAPPRSPPVVTDEDRPKLQPLTPLSPEKPDIWGQTKDSWGEKRLHGTLTSAPVKLQDVSSQETRRRISMSNEEPDESEVEAQERALQRVRHHLKKLNGDLDDGPSLPPPVAIKRQSTRTDTGLGSTKKRGSSKESKRSSLK